MAELSMEQVAFDWSVEKSSETTPPSPTRPHQPTRMATGKSTAKLRGAPAEPELDADERRLRWLTAEEAMAHLGFPSRKALYAAVERGQVPAHKLGRRLRFRRTELDALLDRGR